MNPVLDAFLYTVLIPIDDANIAHKITVVLVTIILDNVQNVMVDMEQISKRNVAFVHNNYVTNVIQTIDNVLNVLVAMDPILTVYVLDVLMTNVDIAHFRIHNVHNLKLTMV